MDEVFWYCCCRGVAGATRWASCSAKAKIQRGSCLFEEAVLFVACCFLAEISSSSSSSSPYCSSCRHFHNWEERYRDRQRGVGRSREGGFVLVHDLSSLECLSKLPVAICNSTSGNLAIAGGDHEPETLTNELGSALPVLAPVSGHGIPGGRIASHLHGNHDS